MSMRSAGKSLAAAAATVAAGAAISACMSVVSGTPAKAPESVADYTGPQISDARPSPVSELSLGTPIRIGENGSLATCRIGYFYEKGADTYAVTAGHCARTPGANVQVSRAGESSLGTLTSIGSVDASFYASGLDAAVIKLNGRMPVKPVGEFPASAFEMHGTQNPWSQDAPAPASAVACWLLDDSKPVCGSVVEDSGDTFTVKGFTNADGWEDGAAAGSPMLATYGHYTVHMGIVTDADGSTVTVTRTDAMLRSADIDKILTRAH